MAHLYITPNQKPPPFIHSSLPNLQSWKWWTASESRTALLSFVQMIEKAKMKWKRMSTTDTKRVTLAVALEANGRMLPPLLIFKGTQKG
jgi:ABC-type branched-subunit amino acid transport system ATPase component